MSLAIASAAFLALGGFSTVWQAAASVGRGLVPEPPADRSVADDPVPAGVGDSAPPDSANEAAGERDSDSLVPPWFPDLSEKSPAPAQSRPMPESTPSASPSPKPEPTSTRGSGDGKRGGEKPAAQEEDSADSGTDSTETESESGEAATKRGRLQEAVVELTNSRRVAAGCEPLRVDEQLLTAARAKSADMARKDYFAHTSPSGLSLEERVEALGYERPGGENIARGQETATNVFEEWMESPGHRENIMDCSFEAIGVGVYFTEDGGPYWTQVFGYE